ncbi:MAG: hypothetical protein CR997_11270 [Acidobacteria bacterium]|nr:MAG: hypothetical protein CR997_11270 [Acidobacteriota bacterium]
MKHTLAASILLFLGLACSTNTVKAESHVQVQLISSHSEIETGKPFQLGIHIEMQDHWHTYWENPGSSGIPTDVAWTEVSGLDIGALQFPLPKKYVDDAGFVTYGYDDKTTLIANAVYTGSAKEIDIKGVVSWLECKGICLPGEQKVQLVLKTGQQTESKEAALFKETQKMIPVKLTPAGPFEVETSLNLTEDVWNAKVDLKPKEGVTFKPLRFFPGYQKDSEMTSVTMEGNRLLIEYSPWAEVAKKDLFLYGVLEVEINGSKELYRIPVFPQELPKEKAGGISMETPAEPEATTTKVPPSMLYILLLAFFGGLILNLMPCVLPVLSLKVFSIINEAGESAARRIQFGWMYTLGIMVSFAILAGFLIAAKAAGESLGIGFQFQNPGFVIFMIALIFVMALSFVGVFEIEAPQSQKIQGLAQKRGLLGAFYQGGLMTILSTPCTAPGLGAAYGWAVTAESWQILVIFELIAFGLATPYLVLCYSPGLLKFLPKPGAWMDYFKVVMGFLLFATVIWLMNTLMNLSGSTAIIGTLTLLLFLACAAWIHGKTFFHGPKAKGLIVNVLLIICGVWLGLFKLFDVSKPFDAINSYKNDLRLKFLSESQSQHGGGQQFIEELEAMKTTAEKIAWIPYSPKVLEHFRNKNKLVFLDFTAEWCATCKVNEKLVVDTKGVRSAFAKNNVVTMKVDYTDEDPKITEFIHSFKRAGVPIYLFYPGEGEPILLPETITTGLVLDGLNEAKEKM